jgi:hypothetical protein
VTVDDRWRRVRDLFERALEEEPRDLKGWLAREAPLDEAAHADVVSLMDHHRRAGSFLCAPPDTVLADLLDDEPPLMPGQTLGPYTIDREIGRGGMGRVYLAQDAKLGRKVALKALPPELTRDPSHRDRLRREARAAAALSHPGICTVFALEELDGHLFIATEFVDGATIRYQLDCGRRPKAEELTRVAGDLAAALAHAHEHGVVHRDLKPDNVMIAADGRVKILDFGLARLTNPEVAGPPLTQPGTVFGTPAYMAPEQLQGQAVDARADVFAFGVLLYEYACGTHPFQAATPLAIAARILESDPEPVIDRRPDTPPAIAAVIDRCLSKAPGGRFAAGGAIVRALAQAPREAARAPRRLAAWWRTHQAVAIALYFIASTLCWQIKEWQPGAATAIFVLIGVASTVAGVFRGHLLFTERMNAPGLAAEHRRATRVTLATDLVIAAALAAAGMLLASTRPLAAVLTIALGVGIAMTRTILEPSTTAAFLDPATNP